MSAKNKVKSIAEQAVLTAKVDLEKLFGSAGVQTFLKAAEELLKTAAGAIIKKAVKDAQTALPDGLGAAKHALASDLAKKALESAGISLGTQILNLAIESVLASL